MKLSPLHAIALVALIAAAAPLASGCSNDMDPKECDRIRGEAFELVNKAQHCNGDADCKQSEWPGCQKPLSVSTLEKIRPMKDSFGKGKCAEKKDECKPPPEVYCKQGLCVHREKGSPDGQGSAPGQPAVDQIIVK